MKKSNNLCNKFLKTGKQENRTARQRQCYRADLFYRIVRGVSPLTIIMLITAQQPHLAPLANMDSDTMESQRKSYGQVL